jgi:cholestenol delta-isomerase
MANSANLNSYHPYYPAQAQIIGYLANEWSVPTLLALFAGGAVLILGITVCVVSQTRPNLRKADKIAILWFIFSMFVLNPQYSRNILQDWSAGSIHLFFEGYFVINHKRMASAQDIFGQLWKEYSLSDSRYLTSDPFVLCMEAITAVSSARNHLSLNINDTDSNGN